jgi:Sulfatase
MDHGIYILLFAMGLFLGMLILLEVGRRIGARRLAEDPQGAEAGVGTVEGAVFALLGLLIAFIFSGAAARFDTRRQLIVEETNDIGTAYPRLDLMPVDAQPALREKFRQYVEHDGHVGQLLDKLKELGLDENTIVMYSTDNGAEVFTWPDGGQTPFRGEKASNWEGGYRVPCAIRWPGVIKPGTVLNDIFAHEDMLPTLLAAAGEPDVVEKLKKGMKVGDKTFKVHLDGYNITDALAGKAPSPRKEFFYFNDDGSLVALRYNQWKLVFAEQRSHGFGVWQDPFTPLRFPKLFNIRSDPFETADQHSMGYERWMAERMFLLVPAQEYVGQFLATFREFPPSQKPGSFSLDQVLEKLTQGAGDK